MFHYFVCFTLLILQAISLTACLERDYISLFFCKFRYFKQKALEYINVVM